MLDIDRQTLAKNAVDVFLIFSVVIGHSVCQKRFSLGF